MGPGEVTPIVTITNGTEYPPLLKIIHDTAVRPEEIAPQALKMNRTHLRALLETRCMNQEMPAHPESTGTGMNRKKKLRLEKTNDQLLERKRNTSRAFMPLTHLIDTPIPTLQPPPPQRIMDMLKIATLA